METTIKEISLDLGTSGSYDGVNYTFGTLQTIFNEPSMSYKSGKVIDITVVVSGSRKTPKLWIYYFFQRR